MLHDRLTHIIANIYESAQDWELVVRSADLVLRELEAGFGFIAVADGEALQTVNWLNRASSRYADVASEYQQEMQPLDPVLHFASRHPHARIFDSRENVKSAEVETSPYLRWFRSRFQTDHWMVAYAPSGRNFRFGLSVQPLPQRSFSAEERAKFAMLFEHFERARRLAARPMDLTSHDAAVALVDGGGTLLAMSPAAQAIIEAQDGLFSAAGILAPELATQRSEWNALLRSAARALQDGTAGGVMLVRRSSGRRPLVATIDPFPSSAQFYPSAEGRVLVRILDASRGLPYDAAWRWRTAFGLTPAEARLATALMECEGSVREAAAKLGIAYPTARVQLATMFHKTDTRTQAALTRLLVRTSFTASR